MLSNAARDSPLNEYLQENEQFRAALRTATKSSYREDNIMSASTSDSTPGPSGPPTGRKRAFSPGVVEIDSDDDVPVGAPRQIHKRHRSNTYHNVSDDGENVPMLVRICTTQVIIN